MTCVVCNNKCVIMLQMPVVFNALCGGGNFSPLFSPIGEKKKDKAYGFSDPPDPISPSWVFCFGSSSVFVFRMDGHHV